MTSPLCKAKMFDAEERLVDAACAYEEALSDGSAQLTHFLNLMVLYCESMDPGINIGEDIGSEFASVAFERLDALPQEIEMRFGFSHEAQVWSEYAKVVHIGGEPDTSKWLAWVEAGLTLVPLIALAKTASSGRYDGQLELLRSAALGQETERGRYILNMIDHFPPPAATAGPGH